jgi:OCT family organic cation transporter-like MFS transporter 18
MMMNLAIHPMTTTTCRKMSQRRKMKAVTHNDKHDDDDDDKEITSDASKLSMWMQFLGARDAASASTLLLVHANIVAYAFAYWLTQPMLPFLSKQLGASDVIFGWLSTVFSLVQLIGGPVIGRLCDTRGARIALQVSQLGAGASYLLLGCATSIEWLFASRLPTVVMHAMQASQAFVAVHSLPSVRAVAIGRISLSYGIGMVAGSSVGGILSTSIGYSAVAFLAALISVAFVACNAVLLPSIQVTRNKTDAAEAAAESSFSTVFHLVRNPRVARLLAFQICVGIALSMYATTFSMAAVNRFGFDTATLGLFQSGGALMGVIANTVLVGATLNALGGNDWRVLQLCAMVMALCFVAYAYLVRNVTDAFVLGVPFAIASSFFYTVATSALSKSTDGAVGVAGTTIGLGHAGARVLRHCWTDARRIYRIGAV